ncbi:MAG TPA: histidine kinase N-terminal 7TM domain-containing protein, partial [Sphingobacteriaceae bacterium]
GLLMMAAAVWCVGNGFQFTAQSLSITRIWITIEYLGIATMAPLWILFTMSFAGFERFFTVRRMVILFLVPVLTVTLVATDPYHNLHYRSLELIMDGPLPMMQFESGIWYWVHLGYFYLLFAAGGYILVRKYQQSDAIFRRQNKIIMVGAFLPVIFNLIYQTGYKPSGLHIDITPFSFLLSSLLVGFGIIRYQLFDIVPIARERILEAMADGILVTDPSRRIVDVNPAMVNILSGKCSNPLGHSLEDVLPDIQTALIEDDGSVHRKFEFNFKNGLAVRCYEVTVTALVEKENLSGRILVFKDITERKQYEEKLESLNKLKDKLFSVISHDLRSPLISLMDLLSMTNEGMISDDELKEFLPQLQKNVGYTSSLLENLLQWSKSQLQNERVRPAVLDMNKISHLMIDSFRDRAADKGITLNNEIRESAKVFADPDMINAVYRNLLSNAIKFCSDGDAIRVSGEVSDDSTTICVSDTGVGIPEADLKRLFKADTFTKRGTNNEQGTGLGLLLAKDFIEKNHGRIWVESRYGEGSSFYFSLPNGQIPVAQTDGEVAG